MMNIISAKINWMKGYGNHPILEVTVDELPKLDELVYTRKPDGFYGAAYFAQSGDYVHFFYHSANNETGFGGRIFTGKLDTGETFKVKGPWSSNCQAMNMFGFPRTLECTYQTKKDGRIAGHILEPKALELIKQAGADYSFSQGYNETDESPEAINEESIVLIKHKGMTFEESQKHKNSICSCDERRVQYCPIHGISAQLNRSQME
jgi:hypothetical protein